VSTSSRALTPGPEGASAVSVLESGVTRVSPRSASGVTKAPATTANPSPAAPLAETPSPSKPQELPAVKTISARLVVLRGEKLKATFPIYDGKNTIGRFADKPVDVDLEGQETIERIRVSRHHATIHFDQNKGELRIEDINSLNGTWVNGVKLHPGQFRKLAANDVIQVGTVQLRLEISQDN
jgi:pSer/pThr/pTyr-binding forkhead associated (FHA) protein